MTKQDAKDLSLAGCAILLGFLGMIVVAMGVMAFFVLICKFTIWFWSFL